MDEHDQHHREATKIMSGFDINQLTISGNLAADAELRQLHSGHTRCKIRIAHNERRKLADGDWIDNPQFFDVTLWAGVGEWTADNLTKGDKVVIAGRLRCANTTPPTRQAPGDRHHRRQHRPRTTHHHAFGRRRRRRHPVLRARARGLPEQGGPLRASPERPETRPAPTPARLRHASEPTDFEPDCSARTPGARAGNH
jgi:single-stranded DNA-binding protein